MRQWLQQYARLDVVDDYGNHWLADRSYQYPVCDNTKHWIQQRIQQRQAAR